MSGKEDPLAYGYYGGQGESERGSGDGRGGGGGGGERSLLGGTLNKFRDKVKTYAGGPGSQQPYQQSHYDTHNVQQGQSGSHGYGQPYPPQPPQPYAAAPGQQPYNEPPHGQNPPYHENKPSTSKPDMVSGLLGKIQGIGSGVAQKIGSTLDPQAYAQYGPPPTSSQNRFGSFAPPRDHCDAKWYIDGCDYMYAVSRALENAKESIWILDWWLSPELYLRRPPSKNEQYRLDRMVHAAAQRGVRVNVIVYKEVTQAMTLSSSHTKHHLQNLHPNIAVFRHPDHLPDRQTIHSSVVDSFKNLTLNAAGVSKLSADALKGLYGMSGDVVLYWAHHEKLCLIDGKTAFLGGLDLCYGRWDTNQHSLSDVHPNDIRETVFPGQDYNNARVLDFDDVLHWQNNKLDRKSNSRMGWADISVSLHGPAVEDLRRHFVERWNFIYDEKYNVRQDSRYSRLVLYEKPLSAASITGSHGQSQQQHHGHQPPPPAHNQQYHPLPPTGPPPTQAHHGSSNQPGQPGWGASTQQSQSQTPYSQAPYFPPPPNQAGQHSQTRGPEPYYEHGYQQQFQPGSHQQPGQDRSLTSELRGLKHDLGNFGSVLRGQLAGQVHQYQDRYFSGTPGKTGRPTANMSCQIIRSSAKWSHGTPTEHSIMDAYAAIIRDSEHFVYIENQFFITATGDAQKPIENKVGAAIVERILRAARAGQKYKMIVVIPAVPCFAGELRDDVALGIRAIMEFQYTSINRGGHSIMELISKEGYNPMDYIRFYNLRNYDRINTSAEMRKAEQKSGVDYQDAQKQHDDKVTASTTSAFDTTAAYQPYQKAAQQVSHPTGSGRWNSVSECYMLGGEDIRKVPWEHPGDVSEIDAFVSEELYVHSKVLIADDRTVICGSANLNDRSQLGDHDSEIAVIIQDPTPVESSMDGKPYLVSKFATTLRRQLCRKHLGLIPVQDYQRPTANSEPVGVPNVYDMNSAENQIVTDPLSDTFQSFWNSRAKQNTEVYRKVFHAVPDDTVRNWNDYKEFFEYYFRSPVAEEKKKKEGEIREVKPYLMGHVIRENFPGGVQEVKEELSKVKGTLVEMPLMFLIEEDIAKEGIAFNSLTATLYT
ncbi:phospholipase D [Blastomyces gilchristii SLH14081]|uniref:Phospholipase n=1 Tax=Blastomyces gilchristii (strain SLH14081) TaxID=559298 RepID=A0A179UJF2_BLAGS|nr:phospholipase D [Blastomyces gilchristii SLH14081]OAT06582.1 phospholipase D [Blastomyces gilchristii SLH14081]